MTPMSVAFTGHRKLTGVYPEEGGPVWDWIQDRLNNVIHKAYAAGAREFIMGGALGVDWVATVEALDIRDEWHSDLRVLLILPFPGYNHRWPEHKFYEFDKLQERSDHFFYVGSPEYHVSKLFQRDKVVIDMCTQLVSVTDGRAYGGTKKTIDYALSKSKPIYQFNTIHRTEEWINSKISPTMFTEEVGPLTTPKG